MGRLIGWVTTTHTLRYHAHNHSAGTAHLHQGPFKSFPVQDDGRVLTLCRYVEKELIRLPFVPSQAPTRQKVSHRGTKARRFNSRIATCRKGSREIARWRAKRPEFTNTHSDLRGFVPP